jgi:hypothetical protein
MMVSAKTPYSETILSPGPGGKMVTSHMVQTATTKYVERSGRWTSLPVSSTDLVDTLNDMLKTAKLTCRRTGTEQVNGRPTTIYAVHMEHQGVVTDSTLWISADNRQLKSDTTVAGKDSSATFDYACAAAGRSQASGATMIGAALLVHLRAGQPDRWAARFDSTCIHVPEVSSSLASSSGLSSVANVQTAQPYETNGDYK